MKAITSGPFNEIFTGRISRFTVLPGQEKPISYKSDEYIKRKHFPPYFGKQD